MNVAQASRTATETVEATASSTKTTNAIPPKKLCLKGVPNDWTTRRLDAFLKSSNVICRKVVKIPNQPVALLSFVTEEDKEKAKKDIESLQVDGMELRVEEKKAGSDSGAGRNRRKREEEHDQQIQELIQKSVKKRKLALGEGEEEEEEAAVAGGTGGEENQIPRRKKTVQDALTPLHSVHYMDQIVFKQRQLRNVLRKVVQRTKRECKQSNSLPTWLRELKSKTCCELVRMIPSPLIESYRNKNSFSIGYNDDNELVVGNVMGHFIDGHVSVYEPLDCLHMSPVQQEIRQKFQTYIRSLELNLEPYDKHSNKGFWRELVVRSFQTGETAIVVQVNPEGVEEEKIEKVKHGLRTLFSSFYSTTPPSIPLRTVFPTSWTLDSIETQRREVTEIDYRETAKTIYTTTEEEEEEEEGTAAKEEVRGRVPGSVSLLWCTSTSLGPQPESLPEVLLGSEVIHEELCGLRFRVSGDAFFQVNTLAAEKVYSIAKDWAAVSPDTTLFDICCGTGTIGLSMAKDVKQVIGLDMVKSSIQDAKKNAELNGISNAEFHVGKAEDILHDLLKKHHDNPNVVGIVDPARPGLHPNVLKAIRACTSIKRLVYISCNQASFINDAAMLCKSKSKRFPGDPFVPKKAAGVDLFPHTTHCELIVLLER